MSKKRLFVVSDIHGHYTLLKKALDDAGFDPDNSEHLFVCCGDLFDRGNENRKVYEFIKSLPHKVLICGNHDERLMSVLKEKRAEIFDFRNGIYVTLNEFFGAGSVDEYGDLNLHDDDSMANELCGFVSEMLDYYETEHYVFVHGWLPTAYKETPSKLVEDWRNADAELWHLSRYSEWMSLYKSPAMLPQKTIVCGHRPTRLAERVDKTRSPDDSSIYYGEGMIAIDAGTFRSGRVNVLVLYEDI